MLQWKGWVATMEVVSPIEKKASSIWLFSERVGHGQELYKIMVLASSFFMLSWHILHCLVGSWLG